MSLTICQIFLDSNQHKLYSIYFSIKSNGAYITNQHQRSTQIASKNNPRPTCAQPTPFSPLPHKNTDAKKNKGAQKQTAECRIKCFLASATSRATSANYSPVCKQLHRVQANKLFVPAGRTQKQQNGFPHQGLWADRNVTPSTKYKALHIRTVFSIGVQEKRNRIRIVQSKECFKINLEACGNPKTI